MKESRRGENEEEEGVHGCEGRVRSDWLGASSKRPYTRSLWQEVTFVVSLEKVTVKFCCNKFKSRRLKQYDRCFYARLKSEEPVNFNYEVSLLEGGVSTVVCWRNSSENAPLSSLTALNPAVNQMIYIVWRDSSIQGLFSLVSCKGPILIGF